MQGKIIKGKPIAYASRNLSDTENMIVAEYDFDVIYRAGKLNLNADALSRNPIDNNKGESSHLQVNNNDILINLHGKMTTNKMFTKRTRKL